MSKCLMVIKTSSLKFDDRLRKECISLRDFGIEPEIIVLDMYNKSIRGQTEYGVPFHSITLTSRKIFPHKKFIYIKTFEMYVRFLADIVKNRNTTVWVHNIEMGGLIPFIWVLKKLGFVESIIWDQHELPNTSVLPGNIFRKPYTFVTRLCDKIITANERRKEHMKNFMSESQIEKVAVLENYPDKIFINLPKGTLPESAKKWLGDKEFILAQGGANRYRHLEILVEAMVKQETYKLIIVGPYEEEQVRKLGQKWGAALEDTVLFFGAVPQMSLVNFNDTAKASIILYEKRSMNQWLCAPNRLYQALSRGTPVIVGANPPMLSLVKKFNCGVALENDGGTVAAIQDGIKELTRRYDELFKNAQLCKENWVWEGQGESFKNLFPNEISNSKPVYLNKQVNQ